jgi:mannosyl-3-phosphoglycerate phosphatase
MILFFTDLDGTLLDHSSYDWEAARPAVEYLNQQNLPWIMVSSKTRAEMEVWRQRTGNQHPFIVENGAAAFVPRGYFSFSVLGAVEQEEYEVLQWGTTYSTLVEGLQAASAEADCAVRGFHAMSIEELASTAGLSAADATLAKQREYGEPFLVLEPNKEQVLLEAISRRGLRWTKGGRFWHITGQNDKAAAVVALRNLFARMSGDMPPSIGLGDSFNDISFLKVVDVPVVIRSRSTPKMKEALPHARVSRLPGPEGWNQEVLSLLAAVPHQR